jgi:hypothetical protein
MWKAIGQHSKAKMLKDPRKRALNKVWGKAYDDSRKFQHARVELKQADTDRLLTASVAEEVEENVALYEKMANEIAVVPIDPTMVLCRSNSAIVAADTIKTSTIGRPDGASKQLTRSLSRNSSWELGYGEPRCGFNTKHQSTKIASRTRKLLIKQWKLFGKEKYCKLLQKEQSFWSMHPIENLSDSPGSPADNSDGKTLHNENVQVTEH